MGGGGGDFDVRGAIPAAQFADGAAFRPCLRHFTGGEQQSPVSPLKVSGNCVFSPHNYVR